MVALFVTPACRRVKYRDPKIVSIACNLIGFVIAGNRT